LMVAKRNCASWAFLGIGCVLIKHINTMECPAGDSTEAIVTMLLELYEYPWSPC
jgi:hypothetical protein